ncbi:MAG: phosphoribosylformylglycinamidine synthase subunit PurQ, partial [Clostridiales bacterium]|nr:phosphoribosylformylglycinamidine synthase subunit PurQ [Clostridiales bacterium]
TVVAEVTEDPRLVMTWNGKTIVNVSSKFLNSTGAEKHIDIAPAPIADYHKPIPQHFAEGMKALAGDLNVCSKRGLAERFDSTIGAGTVLMPFGGKYQMTPPQAMVHLVSVEKGHTDTVSYMAWGGNPYVAEKSPFHGAYFAVVESISKLIATGASFEDVYLTFQEYFEKPMKDEARWGKPLAALLGAFKAQTELGCAAIGGKDSMSGTFEHIDVPPTLVSFAVTTGKVNEVVSPEFKAAGHKVVLVTPEYDKNGLPVTESLIENYQIVTRLMRMGKVAAAFTPTYGGVAEGVLKSCLGNRIGFAYDERIKKEEIFGYSYGAFVLELTESVSFGKVLGVTTEQCEISCGSETVSLDELAKIYEDKLEPVYACNIATPDRPVENFSCDLPSKATAQIKNAMPRVLIPVFPGTNCEYDTAKAFADAGALPEIFVIRNNSADDVARSVEKFASLIKESNIVFIPGGFSGGDE